MIEEAFGTWLRRVRQGLGVPQDDIAVLLNVKRNTISTYERGLSKPRDLIGSRLLIMEKYDYELKRRNIQI